MSILRDSHEAVIAHRAAAAVSASTARHRPAAASARAWIDSLSARAHQRSIRRVRPHATAAATVVD
ncbi:hypothetical protein [Mycobacterium kyorinense]|uniref:Uncharacterized protein n=1 Tax=Mycobacterium kyorinense TaxID=487514 RepID=A0A1X1Y5J0_9MYCO|nr:hypothetical protein [Mycobacterium kyorinense]ORW06393.1 hypothetical protein AWC14_25690 [Mycobacterium kyorinense]